MLTAMAAPCTLRLTRCSDCEHFMPRLYKAFLNVRDSNSPSHAFLRRQERTDQQQGRHELPLFHPGVCEENAKCSAALTDGGVRAATQARLRLQGPPGGLSLATCKPRDGARFRGRCPDRPAGRSPPPRARALVIKRSNKRPKVSRKSLVFIEIFGLETFN